MIKFVTFDCYDTLVAYTAGKHAAIRAIVVEKGAAEKGGDAAQAEAVIAATEAREHALLNAPDFKLLSVVLRESLEAALTGAGLPYAPDDGARLIQAVKDARPFDDVAPALERLRTKYKTAILSNSERAMMQHNRTRLGVPFDEAVLADEVGAYKPDPRMFAALLDRCGCTKDEIVHVAQGFYHDIMPCHALGIRRVWINRNRLAGDKAHGPYEEFPDLSAVPGLLGV
ncbi:MAG TPA: haloacid dehalogenase type II [Kiloniellaceae bacterium]